MIRAGVRAAVELAAIVRGVPDLRVLVLAGGLGALGAGLLSPVLPLHLEARGLDPERIGLVFTLGSILPILAQPALGSLSDRIGRKWILAGVHLSASLLLPALALLAHPLPLAVALCARLTLDRSVAPLRAAAVGDVAPATRRATVFGLLDGAVNLILVAALALSSAAVALLGTAGVVWIASAAFLCGGLSLLGLSSPPPQRPAPRAGARCAALGDLAASARYVRRDPALAALAAYQLCFTLALGAFPIYLPLFAVKLGAPAAMVGPLMAASWLVFALAQPIGGHLSDRAPDRRRLITRGLVGMAAAAALLGLSGSAPAHYTLPLLIAAWVLMAIPDGLSRPAAGALLVDLAPPSERGRFLGALGAAVSLANVAAPLAHGVVATRVAPGAPFLLAALALLAAVFAASSVREPARAPAPRLAPPMEVP